MRVVEGTSRSVDDVKSEITDNLGRSVLISEFNKQGKKIHEYNGEITNVYESLFLVRVAINRYNINKSFSYVDFVTSDRTYEILDA